RLGVIHAMADHTTLPSRDLSLRPVGKSSEASELPLGSKPVRLRTSISFTGLPPKSDDLHVNEYGLPLDRLRQAPSRSGRAARRDARRGLTSSGVDLRAESPCPACCQTNARSRGRATGILDGARLYQNSQTLTHAACRPTGTSIAKRTVV